MTDLRQAAQMALEALEFIPESGSMLGAQAEAQRLASITSLRTALEQQAEPVSELQKRYLESEKAFQQQAEPVAHSVIAGALFDFMGWLTTRKERLVLSSTDNASPAADAIKDFAEMRGLLLDDAKVQDWQDYTTPPQREWVGLTDEDWAKVADMPDTFDQGVAWAQARLKERNT